MVDEIGVRLLRVDNWNNSSNEPILPARAAGLVQSRNDNYIFTDSTVTVAPSILSVTVTLWQ